MNTQKIGQLMLWLSEEVPNLYITKLLKLLYLCDETAVKKTGVPITWLKYNVWQFGPVPVSVYNDLNFNNASIYGDYVKGGVVKVDWSATEKEQLKISPVGVLNKKDFSIEETLIIKHIIDTYSHKTAKELVKLLHQDNTLWHKIYLQKNLEKHFSLPECYTSPYEIDLSKLLKGDEQKLEQYKSMEEFRAFINVF
ncbi:MAG: Panacea domain-containing protein [Bacteroidota bacterium]